MYYHDILKLLISAVFGVLLGLEREIQHKPLGVKTCLVIAVSSCLITIVSIDSSTILNPAEGALHADPMRLAAQIVSGTGFIGAGVIMHRNNEVVSGLTTAAMVWAAAGLGIAVGAGFYEDACVGIAVILLVVHGYPLITGRFGPRRLREQEIQLVMLVHRPVDFIGIGERLQALQCRMERIKSTSAEDDAEEITMTVVMNGSAALHEVYSVAISLPGVVRLEAQSKS